MELHTIGVDLAKTVFHLVGLNLRGEVVVHEKISELVTARPETSDSLHTDQCARSGQDVCTLSISTHPAPKHWFVRR
jgi:hypothetical protein